MSDTRAELIKAPVALYVIWVAAAILMAMANRYVGVAVLAMGAIHIFTYPARIRANRAAQTARATLAAEEAAKTSAKLEKVTSGPLEPITASKTISQLLASDEECYWEEPAVEWRMQTYVDLGSSGGSLTRTRVIPEQIGSGFLAITESRLIFRGDSHVHDLRLNEIAGVGEFADGIRVVDARDRTMLFVTASNYAAIILRRVIADSDSRPNCIVAELPSHCASCGAPLRLVHHACTYCGAPVSHLPIPPR